MTIRHVSFAFAYFVLILSGTIANLPTSSGADESSVSPDDKVFFEKKVMPVLKQRCYECHSHQNESKIAAGFVVDSKAGMRKGGDSGVAIVPGNPDVSLFIKSIRYDDVDLQMPPKEKLTKDEIDILEEWVRRGAPDPRAAEPGVGPGEEIWERAKTHWAFQPIEKASIPKVDFDRWNSNPIDAFVLSKLRENGLKPSERADRTTLIRRVTFDLIGLPPTIDEVKAFLADESANAWEKVVNRLLDSPHYGERWGRYWLDVARYADTTGETQNIRQDTRYLYAYTYRDYVINAFNADTPYDQFVREQLAADRLFPTDGTKPADPRLAALGYLTVGKRFGNNIDDVIDDRIDVVSRGLLGLTVNCARCHDHKFDPIPTEDYYSWHGVFASSQEPEQGPVIGVRSNDEQYNDFLKQLEPAERKVAEFEDAEWTRTLSAAWHRFGDYLIASHENTSKGGSAAAYYRSLELSPALGQRFTQLIKSAARRHDPVFAPWIAFANLKTEAFAKEAPGLAEKFAKNDDAKKPIHPQVAKLFSGDAPTNLRQVADRYQKLFAEVDEAFQAKRKEVLAANANERSFDIALADAEDDSLRKIIWGKDALARPDQLTFRGDVGLKKANELGRLQAKANDIKLSHPGSPSRAMVLNDAAKPKNSKVYVRGDKSRPGPEVPRQFLEVLAGKKRAPFSDGSGRLELANAIADKNNPLTARVMVNRVWLNHFGQGLVGTPSDFGLRGESPTHPELLDYLANYFMEHNWSLKQLHRHIVSSETYQQSSELVPSMAEKDPENKFYWRANRQRLDLEALRDTILSVSGSLSSDVGGRSVDILGDTHRRTIYSLVDRLNLPGVFMTFDFAIPDMSSPQRNETTVPTQALFMMNSPFVVEEAKKLAANNALASITDPSRQIQWLYERLFQRSPTESDLVDGLEFLKQQAAVKATGPEEPIWKYGFGLVQERNSRVNFTPMRRFANEIWVQNLKPDGNPASTITLSDEGGQTGGNQAASAIRRWTSPITGAVQIDGVFRHSDSKDPGKIVAQMVVFQGGKSWKNLGRWEVDPKSTNEASTPIERLEVSKGDTIDFVVTSLTGKGESFDWAPVVSQLDYVGTNSEQERHQWSAETDFAGPAPPPPKGLTPIEKYIQALLLTNELAYVN